ncbi:hypothetical protein CLOM_g12927 [Closterium sp. NIES-68]|nr:hypothetical protein CLOM_g12927 [Closterium sp. NIES-68]
MMGAPEKTSTGAPVMLKATAWVLEKRWRRRNSPWESSMRRGEKGGGREGGVARPGEKTPGGVEEEVGEVGEEGGKEVEGGEVGRRGRMERKRRREMVIEEFTAAIGMEAANGTTEVGARLLGPGDDKGRCFGLRAKEGDRGVSTHGNTDDEMARG